MPTNVEKKGTQEGRYKMAGSMKFNGTIKMDGEILSFTFFTLHFTFILFPDITRFVLIQTVNPSKCIIIWGIFFSKMLSKSAESLK